MWQEVLNKTIPINTVGIGLSAPIVLSNKTASTLRVVTTVDSALPAIFSGNLLGNGSIISSFNPAMTTLIKVGSITNISAIVLTLAASGIANILIEEWIEDEDDEDDDKEKQIYYIPLNGRNFAWHGIKKHYKNIAKELGVLQPDTEYLTFGINNPKPPRVYLRLSDGSKVERYCNPVNLESVLLTNSLIGKIYNGKVITNVSLVGIK